jgi:hypothetical protein
MLLPLVAALLASAAPPETAPAPRPVELAVVESSLASAPGRVRQLAFDADPASYFASGRNATKADHLTLTFDNPVALKSVTAVTGRADGRDALGGGVLEASSDGTAFEELAKLNDGKATAPGQGRMVKAVRVRPTNDLAHPLVVREFTIDSDPQVVTFRYPIEFTLDVTDAPEMQAWGDKVVRVCERQYPSLCDDLASDGYRPPTEIRLTMKADYNGVAEAGGARIKGSVKYFQAHPGDLGAMVHETAHCVQDYRARGLPGWLVEGIADYERCWKYEPGKARPLNPDRAQYNGSYQVSAAFLAYVCDTYDHRAVTKLNAALRAGKYDAAIWKGLTGKPVEELNQEWRRSLAK